MVATTPFVVEKLIAIVSESHGSPGRIARAGPRVHDQLAPVVDGDRRAAAALVARDPPQRLGDGAEIRVHESGDHSRRSYRADTPRTRTSRLLRMRLSKRRLAGDDR